MTVQTEQELFTLWQEFVRLEEASHAAIDAAYNAERALRQGLRHKGQYSLAETGAWKRACDDIETEYGIARLKEDEAAIRLRVREAFDRFIAMPASSLHGVALKTGAFLHFAGVARNAWLTGNTDDLECDHKMLLSLRRDLLRLAHLPDAYGMEFSPGLDTTTGAGAR
jgi:hypothetical protein